MTAQQQSNKQTLIQTEEQKQMLKPLAQAEIRLLRMSQQEFEQDVRNQLDTNPALEEIDDEHDDNDSDTNLDNTDTEVDEKKEYSKEDYDNDRVND